MSDSAPSEVDQAPRKPAVGRVLMGVLIFQLGLAVLLFWGDLGQGLRLPGFGPKAPELTEPIRPGDQTRRYRPDRAPNPGQPMPQTALPERLILTPVSGGRAALLEGAITAGDAERIVKQLAELSPQPEEIYLNSPGGSVRDAMELGRYLRGAGINTALRDGDVCYSACPYLLAGGASRAVPDSASVGVHQHYFGQSTILPAFVAVEDIQRGQGEVMRYLDDMGIDPLVMQHALVTPPGEIYVLLPDELRRYGFIPTEE
ncbi:ATP-dependent Clp protease proteolytic subunit [Sulfitobacter sp. PS-8MA]|uniref:ATP-dependent Clp protease proteolytic subunit n=1 Tax=Sulfitobacter sp. PS-8MA TaxID=3237707 RepID=UPI0034C6C9F3